MFAFALVREDVKGGKGGGTPRSSDLLLCRELGTAGVRPIQSVSCTSPCTFGIPVKHERN